MPKKISVIIPVYNGQQYLERCIDSLLAQDGFPIDDLEILLIDDGSRDDSLATLRRYEAQHEHAVKVISHPNVGVAKTRNKGISLASGKYTMFLDQDDWVDVDYCNKFYTAIEESGADVVAGGYRRPDERGVIRQTEVPRDTEYQKYIIMASWAKIHRTSFLKASGVEFFPNKFGEDSVFTIKEIAHASKWLQIDYVGYNWFFNETSVSNTSQRGLSEADNTALIALLDELLVAGDHLVGSYNFGYFLLRTVVFYLLFSGRRAPRSRFLASYRVLFAWLERNASGVVNSKWFVGSPQGETFTARSAIRSFVFLHKAKLVKFFTFAYCRRDDTSVA